MTATNVVKDPNQASSPLADPESSLDEQAESTSAKLEITLAKAKLRRLRTFNMFLPFLFETKLPHPLKMSN